MGQIEVIAASAGTGKTHRLATLLESEVVAGRVRPDAIVATTFTNKAAAELEERVRGRLLRAGRVEAARLLGASRIGTVHAVCTRLVMDFAFELGLSPSLRVLDEELAYHALKEALSRVVDRSTLDELQGLASRMPRFKPQERGGQRLGGWQRAIDTLVDHARSNRISAEQLHDAAAPAWDGFARLLDPPDPAPAALERRLAEVTAAFVDWAEANDPTRTTRNAVDRVRPIADRLRAGLPITWHDWASLAALPHAAKASEPLAEEVRRAALAFTRHPQLHHDARRAIELVHQTAARALQAYEEHKRTWGVVDFRDQEVLALDLLGRADVRARLEDELDLVLVDEFQDTSPIQLAIFLRLATPCWTGWPPARRPRRCRSRGAAARRW
jgi:ATP-dependent helicase/nuclease subunit A